MNIPFGNGDKTKPVHTPGYDGPDRRDHGRRYKDIIADNLRLISSIIGLLILVLSMGVAWGVAKTVLSEKIGRTEFVEKNASQDRSREIVESRQSRLEAVIMERVVPQLDRLEARVTAIYCDGKPPGCK